mmetsp:Transcript_14459/g.36183  ORF Transcript_14459/g.36183 Transcript_14459/m.36183 type:complete len:1211 (-) Transcript_14459:1428-5060(-)
MADDRLYVIKNTFLDIPLLEAEEDIPRSSTAPAPADKRFVHVPPEAVQARSQTRGDQVSAFRGIPEETASDLQSESRSPSAVYPQKTQDSVFERPTPRLNRYVTWDRYETDAADPNALWSGHSQQSNVSMPPKQRSADSSAVSGGHSLQSNVSAPAKNQSVSAPSGQRAYENVWRGHSNVSAPAAGPRVPLQSGANGSSKAASSSTAAQYASARAAVGASSSKANGGAGSASAPPPQQSVYAPASRSSAAQQQQQQQQQSYIAQERALLAAAGYDPRDPAAAYQELSSQHSAYAAAAAAAAAAHQQYLYAANANSGFAGAPAGYNDPYPPTSYHSAYHGADGNSPLHTAPNSPLHALAAGPTPGALNYNQQYGPYHVDPTALYGQYNPQTHQHQVLVYDNVSPMSGLGGAADRPQFLSAESTPHPGTSGSQTQTAQSLSFRSPRVSGLQEGGGVQEAGPGQNYQDHMTFLYPAAQETITTTSQDHTMHSGSTAELMSNNRGSTSPVLLSSQGGLGSGLVQTTIQAGALGPGDQSPGATSPIVQAGVPVGGGGTLAPGAGAGRREQTPSGGVRSLQDLLAQVGSYDAELMEKLQSQIAKVGGGTDAARGGAAASSTQAPRAGGSAHVPAVGAGVAQNQIPNTGGRPSGPGPIVHSPPQAGEDGGLSPAQYGNPPGIDLGAPGYAGGTASAGVSGGAAAPSHQSQTSRLTPPPPPPGAPRGSGAHAAYSRSVYNNPVGGGGARASAAGATGNDRTSAVSDGYDQGYGNYSKTLLYNNAIGNFGPSNKGYELDGVYGAGGSTNSNNVHERDEYTSKMPPNAREPRGSNGRSKGEKNGSKGERTQFNYADKGGERGERESKGGGKRGKSHKGGDQTRTGTHSPHEVASRQQSHEGGGSASSRPGPRVNSRVQSGASAEEGPASSQISPNNDVNGAKRDKRTTFGVEKPGEEDNSHSGEPASTSSAARSVAAAILDPNAPKPSEIPHSIPATPHSLATQKSQTSGAQRITWNVEAKRLKSTDKLCVSPSFSFHVADDVKYRIVLYPLEANSYNKGQGNFRSSKGRGKIVLKCDTAVADLREKQEEDAKAAGKEPADKVDLAQFNMAFRFLIGGPKGRSKFSRPVTNDFADLGTSGLSKDEESWDLVKYCEQGNLLVGVEAVLNDGSPFPLSWSETGTVSRGQSGTISRGQSAALSANGDSRAINARHGGGTRGYQ